MATPFSVIHKKCLSKLSDYDILRLTGEEREETMLPYLISACTKFSRICKADLKNRDDILFKFNEDLDDEVIEILAVGECFYWLNPKVLNTENFKNVLNTKEFQQFSPEKLLGRLQELRDTLKKEFEQAIIDYSYTSGDLTDLKA